MSRRTDSNLSHRVYVKMRIDRAAVEHKVRVRNFVRPISFSPGAGFFSVVWSRVSLDIYLTSDSCAQRSDGTGYRALRFF